MQTATIVSPLSWLTDPTDTTGVAVVSGTATPAPFTATKGGEIRRFAGNRRKPVPTVDDDLTASFTFPFLTWTDWQTLLGWRGRTLLLRTWSGEKFYVAFFAVPAAQIAHHEYGQAVRWSVELALTEVSWDESVI